MDFLWQTMSILQLKKTRLEHITRIVYFVCAAMAARNISIFSVSFRNKQKINAGLLNTFSYSSQVFFPGVAGEINELPALASSKSSIYFCASIASYLCATVSISHRLDESQGLCCGWADVVHSAFLKTPYWGALIGGNWSSVASIATQVDKTFICCCVTPLQLQYTSYR